MRYHIRTKELLLTCRLIVLTDKELRYEADSTAYALSVYEHSRKLFGPLIVYNNSIKTGGSTIGPIVRGANYRYNR